jgi:cell envelope opacity-associated protein A
VNPPPKSLDEQLAALPRAIVPPQQLWSQIEAAIRQPAPRSRWPLALAASVAVAAVSVMVTWKLLRAPTLSPMARNGAVVMQPVTSVSFALPQQPAYVQARAQLEQVFRERLTLLQPATRAKIEANLKIIRDADDDIRRALEADPASPLLLQQLQSTQRQEVDLYTNVARNTDPAIGRSSL